MPKQPLDGGRRLIKDPPLFMAVAWGFLIGLVAGAVLFGVPLRAIFGKNSVAGVVTLALIVATETLGAYITLTLARKDQHALTSRRTRPAGVPTVDTGTARSSASTPRRAHSSRSLFADFADDPVLETH